MEKSVDIDSELSNLSDKDATTESLKAIIKSLEKKIEQDKDKRPEERFVYILIILMLIDIILFNGATNSWLAIIVLFLQIILVGAVAKRMGVEKIAGIIDRMIDSVAKNK